LRYDALRAVMDRANRLLGSNWTSHDLRHTFTIRALDGGVPLHEVQQLLGHASLTTTSIYSVPRVEEIVAHHRAAFGRPQPATAAAGYDSDDLTAVFGDGLR
jgi:site-specific recombinase XerD